MIVVKKVNPWMGLVFWSNFSDTLQYVKAEINNLVDQRKYQTAAPIRQTCLMTIHQ